MVLKNPWCSAFSLYYFNWFRIEFCVGKKSGWDLAGKSVINNFSRKFSSSKLPGSNFTVLSSKSVRSDFIFYVMLGCPVSMYHISMIPCINLCPHWLLVPFCESGWTPGVGDGQGGLACCDSWGRKESDTTERLNWTELSHTFPCLFFSDLFACSIFHCCDYYSFLINIDFF